LAALNRVARIVGAFVAVIAVERHLSDTDASLTTVQGGAHVRVVARIRVAEVDTAIERMAHVVGAFVAVVAVHRLGSKAESAVACVARRARVVVVAIRLVGRMLAAFDRVAYVVRAEVAVIAVERSSRLASAVKTVVAQSADVAVRAGRAVRGMNAPLLGVARIGCAYVFVVAALQLRSLALAVHARISQRARVFVVARVTVGRMLTETHVVARIIGAGVAVVARFGRT